jgi:hypothetical protein
MAVEVTGVLTTPTRRQSGGTTKGPFPPWMDAVAPRTAARSVLMCGECPRCVTDMVDSEALHPHTRLALDPSHGRASQSSTNNAFVQRHTCTSAWEGRTESYTKQRLRGVALQLTGPCDKAGR